MLSIVFGLASALSWGAGDFTGGLAARRVGAALAVLYAGLIGFAAILVTATLTKEPVPDTRTWIIAALAGLFGSLGLLFLYRAMAVGSVSVAAPVSALLAAALPVVVGILREGFPGWLTFIGFGFALLAVWMISRGDDGVTDILTHLTDLKLPLFAGIGFGFYFVLMHEATNAGSTYWPMVASRAGGNLLMLTYLIFSRASWRIASVAVPIILLNGILDLGGNFFFILAGQAGRLDVAAVLSSLFPGATVLLAWVFLKERLARGQWIGIAAALIAIVLMTV